IADSGLRIAFFPVSGIYFPVFLFAGFPLASTASHQAMEAQGPTTYFQKLAAERRIKGKSGILQVPDSTTLIRPDHQLAPAPPPPKLPPPPLKPPLLDEDPLLLRLELLRSRLSQKKRTSPQPIVDRKSTRLNSSHVSTSYA